VSARTLGRLRPPLYVVGIVIGVTAIVALLRFPETKIPSRLQEIAGVAA
jgi:hypothetical protein